MAWTGCAAMTAQGSSGRPARAMNAPHALRWAFLLATVMTACSSSSVGPDAGWDAAPPHRERDGNLFDAADERWDGTLHEAGVDASAGADGAAGPGGALIDCLEQGRDPRCRYCHEATCSAEVDAAFGASGPCLSLRRCIEDDCNWSHCLSTVEVGAECLAALQAVTACAGACREDCAAPRCGDGIINGGDECDGAAIPFDVTCNSEGYMRGTIGCDTDCRFDRSACRGCDPGTCEGCCDGDRCVPSEARTDALCPTGGTCTACLSSQVCRWQPAGGGFGCLEAIEDGDACEPPDARRCRGEVCSEGVCRSGCAPTSGSCYTGGPTCCNSAATCDYGSPGAPPGDCCFAAGTEVTFEQSDSCCFGLVGNAQGGGRYRCE